MSSLEDFRRSRPGTTLPVKKRIITSSKGPPPTGIVLKNAGGAVLRVGTALLQGKTLRRNPEHAAACLEICKACNEWLPDKERCGLCGCFSAWKSRLSTERCPKGKWPIFDIPAA